MSEHHKTLSPSKFPALLKCACYEAGEVGEAAERGTAQHAVLAASLSGKLFPSMLTIEEEEAVVWAEAQIGALIPGLKLIEEKLVILDDDCTELTFGTADAMSENGRVLIDYKSGLVRNYKPQMAVYAFGAIQRFGIDSVHVVELYGRTKEVIEYDMTEWDCRAIVREVVLHNGWLFHAVNARTQHVHIVISAHKKPEQIMNSLKSWCTRRMRAAGLWSSEHTPWARHGSTRYLWDEKDVRDAANYVLNCQD